ncbi:hypothetical protein L596_024066 [Steinernema carpocapsae]|uniref:Uncharacterized protein n=1 Tax=Steinernema carpocapsae TaxID=34508 RepID=A0A4U5MFM9_STECR|nr:hypothetical protein L596_024066 [Steinernema carpocapsae]
MHSVVIFPFRHVPSFLCTYESWKPLFLDDRPLPHDRMWKLSGLQILRKHDGIRPSNEVHPGIRTTSVQPKPRISTASLRDVIPPL